MQPRHSDKNGDYSSREPNSEVRRDVKYVKRSQKAITARANRRYSGHNNGDKSRPPARFFGHIFLGHTSG
jgi:hypothetical protein